MKLVSITSLIGHCRIHPLAVDTSVHLVANLHHERTSAHSQQCPKQCYYSWPKRPSRSHHTLQSSNPNMITIGMSFSYNLLSHTNLWTLGTKAYYSEGVLKTLKCIFSWSGPGILIERCEILQWHIIRGILMEGVPCQLLLCQVVLLTMYNGTLFCKLYAWSIQAQTKRSVIYDDSTARISLT